MSEHTLKMISSLKSSCGQYIEGRLTLGDLQANIEPVVSNLDNEVEKPLRAKLRHFVARLEHIRFMYDEHEQRTEVKKEIEVLFRLLC